MKDLLSDFRFIVGKFAGLFGPLVFRTQKLLDDLRNRGPSRIGEFESILASNFREGNVRSYFVDRPFLGHLTFKNDALHAQILRRNPEAKQQFCKPAQKMFGNCAETAHNLRIDVTLLWNQTLQPLK